MRSLKLPFFSQLSDFSKHSSKTLAYKNIIKASYEEIYVDFDEKKTQHRFSYFQIDS